jgi:hypothetical protein
MNRCITRAARWVPGGRWIPYTAAQVAARRAARIVCWSVVTLAGPSAPGGAIGTQWLPPLPVERPLAELLPSPAVGAWGPAMDVLPMGAFGAPNITSHPEPTSTPEPGTLDVLAVGAVALIAARRRD